MPPAVFRESSAEVGLVADSKPWVGWGCALADFDNDGWPDCFVANGHVDDNRKDLAPTMSYPEPPLLYRNVPAAGCRDRGMPQPAVPALHPRRRAVLRHAGTSPAAPPSATWTTTATSTSSSTTWTAPPAILRNDTPGDNPGSA